MSESPSGSTSGTTAASASSRTTVDQTNGWALYEEEAARRDAESRHYVETLAKVNADQRKELKDLYEGKLSLIEEQRVKIARVYQDMEQLHYELVLERARADAAEARLRVVEEELARAYDRKTALTGKSKPQS